MTFINPAIMESALTSEPIIFTKYKRSELAGKNRVDSSFSNYDYKIIKSAEKRLRRMYEKKGSFKQCQEY